MPYRYLSERLVLKLFFIFSILFSLSVNAQDTIPFIKGKVNISIRKGTMECHLTMSNIPRIEDYVIRLNAGMNIRYFKNPQRGNLLYLERSKHDSLGTGESMSYYFPAGKRKYLPEEIEFKYLGMYPVFSDTTDLATEDWRGNVAFNNQFLRVDGYQSTWYPVLYDMRRQIIYAQVKYDLDISCDDCNTLFVNGSKPIKAKKANFKNDNACEIALLCGNYDFSDINGTYLLNPQMTRTQQEKFANVVKAIRNYYEKKLETQSSDRITFIETMPLAKNYSFAFVAYPSIINVAFGQYKWTELNILQQKTIAHELGHSYFNPHLNSAFRPVISEGFAEYMALKACRSVLGDSMYNQLLQGRMKPLANFKAVPFERINSTEIFDDKGFREYYIYYYAPVIITAIEKETSEDLVWNWMKAMMTTKSEFTNYEFLTQTLSSVLRDEKKLTMLKEKYLASMKSLENAIETIKR